MLTEIQPQPVPVKLVSMKIMSLCALVVTLNVPLAPLVLAALSVLVAQPEDLLLPALA